MKISHNYCCPYTSCFLSFYIPLTVFTLIGWNAKSRSEQSRKRERAANSLMLQFEIIIIYKGKLLNTLEHSIFGCKYLDSSFGFTVSCRSEETSLANTWSLKKLHNSNSTILLNEINKSSFLWNVKKIFIWPAALTT